MSSSIFWSIIFFISFICIYLGFYLLEKSKNRLNGIAWLPITFITSMCYNAIVAAMINLISIPVNIITISIFNLILGGYFWYKIIKEKKIQKYSFNKFDVFIMFVVVAVVGIIAYRRFGITLQLNYDTSDPSMHLQYAMDIVNSQKVSDMYFAPLNNALFIELLSPFLSVIKYYKIFILSDIVMFLLSGMIFYALISKYLKGKFLKCAGLVTVLLYMLAYPLNNMLFGFVYLGIGVSIIAYIIIVVDIYINDELNKTINIIMISLGCLAIFLCYVLFMPVVYLGTFICLSIYFYNKKELFTRKTFFRYVIIYAIPCIFGLFYTYFGVFSKGVTPSSAISNEGAIYRDLYSNFVFFLPLVLYGIYMIIKKRKLNSVVLIAPILLIFMIGLLVIGLKTMKISSYYYYKNYYLLWLIVMILFFNGIYYLSKVSKEIIVTGFIVCAGISLLVFFNVEERINTKNPLFSLTAKAKSYTDIYSYNYDKLRTPRYFINQSKIDLYIYAESKFISKGQFVPVAGDFEDVYWYEAITNQRQKELYDWKMEEGKFINELITDKDISYITVIYANDTYKKNVDYFKSLEKVYENETGFVAKIK